MEINLSYEQLNNEYSMLMGVLGASVSKHLVDEHLTCIWANDYYYELIGYTKAEYEERFQNQCDRYFENNPEGWKILMDKIEASLADGEKGYSVYLPMVYPNGSPFWIRLQAVFTDEYMEGYQVAYTTMVDVTEMMQVQKEQMRAQKNYETMTREQEMLMSALNVSVSSHLVDEHFTCVWANEFYYKLIGYPKTKYEALFHNHADEYYSNNPEGWEVLTKKVASVLEMGEDKYELIVPMKYEDGSSYWVKLVSFFTDQYVDGYRTSYTVMTDVTELVQTKNELEMMMQAMKVSVSKHKVDEHFSLVWANEFYYQLIGYTKPEYEARFHDYCDEYFMDNLETWDILCNKVDSMYSAGEDSFEAYLPLKLPGGSSRWVKLVDFFTNEYQDGKQLAYTTMIDVTELLQAQQDKTVAYEHVPGFIVKYRILPDRIMMIDASSRIKDFFDVDLNNLSAADFMGVLHPDSRQAVDALLPELRNREALELDESIRVKDKYGRDCWLQLHGTCIDSIADDPVYLVVYIDITDITELRKLQHQLEERTEMLNTALEAAKLANAAKSDFLSRMSHDIRTPMNAIAGMTEIADAHLQEPERVRDCLHKIRLSSHHLLDLINDVLDMSQIESGKVSIHAASFSLPELIREIIMITLPNVRTKHQIFKVHLRNVRQEHFYNDELRLRQILLNLLSNASKFTPEYGQIIFEVEQLSGSSALSFTIADTGPGIKAEFQEHIFETFARERDSRTDRIEGSGLGLAIVKRLTELLGGDVQLDSLPGQGTTFHVTLPMQPIENPPIRYTGEKEGILLVDADPVVLMDAQQTLRSLGAEADCAENLNEALSHIRDRYPSGHGYQMIIMDWNMLRQDDRDMIEQLRREFTGETPLLIISAYDWSEIKNEMAAGIDGYIEKPFFQSTFRDCMLKYLKGEEISSHETTAYDFHDKTFLLVEDNELNREIALELLGGFGASLEAAANGEEALRLFQASAPGYYSLILMDIQMPVMNGYESARAIRALSRPDAGTVPIIAMTADAFVEDIRNAEAAGMNGHMAKPLSFDTLALEIEKYLTSAEC
ncbi:PAS domain-containing hybrid sensor histidine kinase/response regulator [Blautia producta]|uniref:PAS domain-containing hybrid sensor histidine kinase/response regulator n=1 Tax=Blautia producta TaxID=33035 RepID=UPI0031B5FB88